MRMSDLSTGEELTSPILYFTRDEAERLVSELSRVLHDRGVEEYRFSSDDGRRIAIKIIWSTEETAGCPGDAT